MEEREIHRSSITGRFVTAAEVKANPHQTVTEHMGLSREQAVELLAAFGMVIAEESPGPDDVEPLTAHYRELAERFLEHRS